MDIGIAGIGIYIPPRRMTAAELAAATDVPEDIIRTKFGIQSKPVAGPEDTTADMGYKAAVEALHDAQVSPSDIDLIIYRYAHAGDG